MSSENVNLENANKRNLNPFYAADYRFVKLLQNIKRMIERTVRGLNQLFF